MKMFAPTTGAPVAFTTFPLTTADCACAVAAEAAKSIAKTEAAAPRDRSTFNMSIL
jgi:hypothetical protein